jgi:hypothetical protein
MDEQQDANAKAASIVSGGVGMDGPSSPMGAGNGNGANAFGNDDAPLSPRNGDMAALPPHLRQLQKQMSSLQPSSV